jgi:signal transduction histidine kinase
LTARTAVATWTLALVAAAATGATVLTADQAENEIWTLALTIPTGLAFVASGIIVRARRPETPMGLLLIAAGLGCFIGAFRSADDPVLFSLGEALQWLYFGFLVHAVITFPSGRLATTTSRALAAAAYALGTLMLPTLMFFESDHAETCAKCPENLLATAPNEQISAQLHRAHLWIALIVVAAILAYVFRRWATSRAALRRAMTPVFAAFTALMVVLAAQHVVEASAPQHLDAANWALLATLLTVPAAFLFGLFRTRFGAAVDRLVVELSATPPGGVRDALARALGDPTLELAYATPSGRFVDLAGKPFDLPARENERQVRSVERDGQTIAALVHDDSLVGDPLLDAVSAAAGLALDNERLQAQLRARLEELRASRTRLVTAGDEARRKLERNLHDGAQQRLVTLSLALRLAQSKVRDDPDAAEQALAAASDELARALEELRELARGIHPAVLSDRGLGAALEALATRSPVPVDLDELPDERLPHPVEVAGFYVVSEALANVAKYARATFARVTVAQSNGVVTIEVADDGIGGADPADGSGLRGLADRVEALDGHLVVDSRRGAGTKVRAVIPLRDRR